MISAFFVYLLNVPFLSSVDLFIFYLEKKTSISTQPRCRHVFHRFCCLQWQAQSANWMTLILAVVNWMTLPPQWNLTVA